MLHIRYFEARLFKELLQNDSINIILIQFQTGDLSRVNC